ncbi:MAG: 4Fe-4S binding protein [Phycisphaeraceae bacterium]
MSELTPRAMRAMARPTSESKSAKPRRRPYRFWRYRWLVQSGFLALWTLPALSFMPAIFGSDNRLRWLPGCTFHCYACPLAVTACPVGLLTHFSAAAVVPLFLLGVLVLVGALLGSAVCGWACPFGFMQDLLAKIPTPKFHPPAWLGHTRFLVLGGLVIGVPFLWGADHWAAFCSVCPAGAIEAALPRGILPNAIKLGVAIAVVGAALFIHRPWCRLLCPLGVIFASFNRVSLLHLKYDGASCTECNLCRSRCKYGVKVDRKINNLGCIRCTDCAACYAISPALAKLRVKGRPGEPTPPAPAAGA